MKDILNISLLLKIENNNKSYITFSFYTNNMFWWETRPPPPLLSPKFVSLF